MMKTTRILICGKTYPDLSDQHHEMICVAGCLENGSPARLSPVPLRYLSNHLHYRAFDWIQAPIARSKHDHRAESFHVMSKEIRVQEHAYPGKAWSRRERWFSADPSWHFSCMEALHQSISTKKTSLARVKVRQILQLWLEDKTEAEREAHTQALDTFMQQAAFTPAMHKRLGWIPFRIFVSWQSACMHPAQNCAAYTSELQSASLLTQLGNASSKKAIALLQQRLNVQQYDLAFFLGTRKAQPQRFDIIGLWYPDRREAMYQASQLSLF